MYELVCAYVYWQCHKVGQQHHGTMEEALGYQQYQHTQSRADPCSGPTADQPPLVASRDIIACIRLPEKDGHAVALAAGPGRGQSIAVALRCGLQHSTADYDILQCERFQLGSTEWGKISTYERAYAYAEANGCTP